MSGNISADDVACDDAGNNPLVKSPHRKDLQDIDEWRKLTVSLAREAVAMISSEVSALNADDDEGLKGDARLKAMLSLTKAIQSLEDMINRMENAIDAADRYPDNIVEFREKLEKQIAALVDEGKEV